MTHLEKYGASCHVETCFYYTHLQVESYFFNVAYLMMIVSYIGT